MSESSRIPLLRLKIFRGEEQIDEREFANEASISIGRADSSMLVIDDESVGELHAVINVEDDGSVHLLDLGTEAGTKVHGEPVSNVELTPGASFELGAIRLELSYDEPESTTPSVDVRPGDFPPEEAADEAAAAPAPVPTTDWDVEEHDALDERADDIMELVMQSGRGAGGAGIDLKAPKVLEVNQVWQNLLLDTKHFDTGGQAITIGDAVGFRWSLIGIPLGWVPKAWAPILRVSPPMWSEVRNDWRNDFYASDDSLPGNALEHDLFVAEGKGYTARVYDKWEAFADKGDERFTMDELVEKGLAKKTGEIFEVPVTDDLRLVLDADGVVFVSSMVHPGKKVVAGVTDNIDYPFLSIFLLCAFLGGMFGVVMGTSQRPPENELVDIPDRFVELLIEKPEPEMKKDNKPEANPDAGEGAKAKREEGKVGKKDAKMEKAKGNKKEVAKTERDREIAENAGVLGAMDNAGGMDGVFGSSGLDANLTGGIGGLIGAKGVQIGSGGLGSRGSGLGGGGTAEGLGGLGTKGLGSGSSGFGSGGGSFGAKGSGGLSAVSGDPIIMGALDRSLIDAVIKRKMSQIRYCYQRELQKDPSLAGKLVIKFTIAKDGSVSSASPKSSTLGSKAVDSCVVSRFYKMQFPEPKGGGIVIVSYPFIFSPG